MEKRKKEIIEYKIVFWVYLQILPVRPEETCNSAHEHTPLSNDTIDSVLRHREVGRAKDLSAHPRNISHFQNDSVRCIHKCTLVST